jgi:hypothetical protein
VVLASLLGPVIWVGLLPNPKDDWQKTGREIEKWQLKYHIMGENAHSQTMTSTSKELQ